ncbi:MAG: hypothetical protein D6695_11905 [Planctomycetota bacterium]|nr:MAG: hypothetical protein D6695_11905 [Planctomycetota bacterium]
MKTEVCMFRSAIVLLALSTVSVGAQPILTRAELDAILGDQVQLEDFEGPSVPGGLYLDAPNPLNSDTAPFTWDIQPGVTYSSPYWLRLYATFMYGDDSNALAGSSDVLITFDRPQEAVGLDVVSITANLTYHDVVTFYHDSEALGTIELDLPPAGEAFVGWQHQAGITHVSIREPDTPGWAIIDNVAWGLAVQTCQADFNNDGQLDFFDVIAFLQAFDKADPRADLTGDGVFDFFDILEFLGLFSQGCF